MKGSLACAMHFETITSKAGDITVHEDESLKCNMETRVQSPEKVAYFFLSGALNVTRVHQSHYRKICLSKEGCQDSSVATVTRATGWMIRGSKHRHGQELFFLWFWSPPSLQFSSYLGSIPGAERRCTVDHSPLLVSELRMSGAIPLLPLHALIPRTGTTLPILPVHRFSKKCAKHLNKSVE